MIGTHNIFFHSFLFYHQINQTYISSVLQIVPQQSLSEITITFDVLQSLHRPANFLVFGLGRDSLMWASLNPHGTTLFLEEDPKWFGIVTKEAPYLRAHTVRYRTQLREADSLMSSYRSEPACFRPPPRSAATSGANLPYITSLTRFMRRSGI